jgi:hypothetical protein
VWGAGVVVVGWGWIQLADLLGVHNNSVLSGIPISCPEVLRLRLT